MHSGAGSELMNPEARRTAARFGIWSSVVFGGMSLCATIHPEFGASVFGVIAGLAALGLISPNWRARAVAMGLVLLWGCCSAAEYRRGVEYRERLQPVGLPSAKLAEVTGQPIGKAVELLGLRPEDCRIFDEPPGVARGVESKLPDGRNVELWISRQDGMFSEKRDWTFEQIRSRPVARVRVFRE